MLNSDGSSIVRIETLLWSAAYQNNCTCQPRVPDITNYQMVDACHVKFLMSRWSFLDSQVAHHDLVYCCCCLWTATAVAVKDVSLRFVIANARHSQRRKTKFVSAPLQRSCLNSNDSGMREYPAILRPSRRPAGVPAITGPLLMADDRIEPEQQTEMALHFRIPPPPPPPHSPEPPPSFVAIVVFVI